MMPNKMLLCSNTVSATRVPTNGNERTKTRKMQKAAAKEATTHLRYQNAERLTGCTV